MNSRQAVGNVPQVAKTSNVLANNPHVQRLVCEKFNPHNRDHMVAFLCIHRYGKQHPTLRFELEQPFTSVKSMMDAKVADAFCNGLFGLRDEALVALGMRNAEADQSNMPSATVHVLRHAG